MKFYVRSILLVIPVLFLAIVANAQLDPTFGGNGSTVTNTYSEDRPIGSFILPSGKILVVNESFETIWRYHFIRYNADGSLDATYGTGGKIALTGVLSGYFNRGYRQNDGRILLVGTEFGNGLIARLNENGTLDSSFGSSGIHRPNISQNGEDGIYSAAIQPDGKIVVAGNCLVSGSNYDFCAARLNSDGSLDAAFDGPSGVSNGKFLLPITAAKSDSAAALAQQPDGKLLIAGHCDNAANADFCVTRLHPDGSLDASFDGPGGTGNGKFLLPIGSSDDIATAMLLQKDGKIILAGDCYSGASRFCIARLYGGPGYKNCTMDIDGDGKVLASTDGLLLSRVALGMTGSTVLAGATSPTATRDTWPKVRDYLVNLCGMTVAP